MLRCGPAPPAPPLLQAAESAAQWVDPDHEVGRLQRIHRCRRSSLGERGRGHFEPVDRLLRFLLQRRRQRSDALQQVVALLFPAELDDFVVLGVKHRLEVARDVVIEVEPGLGVGTPGVLGFEQDTAKREAQYVDIQRIYLKDAPLVFIANLGATAAWRSNVQGFFIDGLSYYRFEDVTINR